MIDYDKLEKAIADVEGVLTDYNAIEVDLVLRTLQQKRVQNLQRSKMTDFAMGTFKKLTKGE